MVPQTFIHMELEITTYGWLSLALLLFITTFGWKGGLYVALYAVAFIVGSLVAIYRLASRNLGRSRRHVPLPRSAIGINAIVSELRLGHRGYKLDRRLTGSVIIDTVLQEVLFYIFRDYINSWYRKLSEDDEFTHELRVLLQRVIVAFSERSKQVDWVPYLTTSLVDEFASHLRLYRRSCEKMVSLKAHETDESKPAPDLVSIFFDLETGMEHKMSRDLICTSPEHEKQYLQDLSEVLLFLLLPPEDFNNKPFRYILREVIVNTILLPAIGLLADPDYINQTLAWLCSDVPLSAENFMTIVKMSDSVDELVSVQDKVDYDIARLRAKDTGGENDMLIKAQLSSLVHVKECCAYRIKRLQDGATDFMVDDEELDLTKLIIPGQRLVDVPFDVVLNNNVALDSFMEFLSSIGAQSYLSFYFLTDGFRATVEQLLANWSSDVGAEPPGGQDSDTVHIRTMACNIYDQYLADKSPQSIRVDEALVRRVSECIRSGRITSDLFDAAQSKVHDILKEDQYFHAFKRSQHYVKMLVELDLLEASNKPNILPLTPDSDSIASNCDSTDSGTCSVSNDIVMTDRRELPENKYSVVAQITQTGISRDEAGRKDYAVYEITVTKTNYDGTASVWKVLRRYSDFHDLHNNVRDKFDDLSMLNFPAKKTFNNMNRDFLERRRKELDNYLQTLLYPSVLKSHKGLLEVVGHFLDAYWERERSTLARTMDTIVNPFKNSVKSVGNVVLSVPENLVDGMVKMSDGITRLPGNVVDGFGKFFNMKTDSRLDETDFLSHGKVGAGLGLDEDDNIPLRIMLLLMDEVFDLRNKNTWLRRRIVAILRQIIKATFGDMINRKIVDHVEWLMSAEQVAVYVRAFRDAMWPCGILAAARPERDHNTKMRTRVLCKAKLLGYVSDEIKTLVGAETSRVGCVRVFNMFQNKTLNKRLTYVILEGFLVTMFPSNKFQEVFRKIHSQSPRVSTDPMAGKKRCSIIANIFA